MPVWTLSPEQAVQLQACPEQEFLQTLQDRFGYRPGRLLQVGETRLSAVTDAVRRTGAARVWW